MINRWLIQRKLSWLIIGFYNEKTSALKSRKVTRILTYKTEGCRDGRTDIVICRGSVAPKITIQQRWKLPPYITNIITNWSQQQIQMHLFKLCSNTLINTYFSMRRSRHSHAAWTSITTFSVFLIMLIKFISIYIILIEFT